MTADGFRRLALDIPGAVAASHMGHPDFRLHGKIFASLGHPGAGWGMVKLTPEDQAHLLRAHPETFAPAAGAWGKAGGTMVRLRAARVGVLRGALGAAAELIRSRKRRPPR